MRKAANIKSRDQNYKERKITFLIRERKKKSKKRKSQLSPAYNRRFCIHVTGIEQSRKGNIMRIRKSFF